MNIAWSTAAILALLLPGFFFIRGIGLAEPFSRDATPRSPIALLALAVLVSIVTHAIGMSVARVFNVPTDLNSILMLAAGQLGSEQALQRVVSAIEPYRWWIGSYFLTTSLAGAGLGFLLGRCGTNLPWLGQALYEHAWLHKLKDPRFRILAYVLTDVEYKSIRVLYVGEIDRFGIRQDGRFSFLVLKNASRGKLLGDDHGEGMQWKPLKPEHVGLLYLDGESIANIFVEYAELPKPVATDKSFRREALETIESELSKGSAPPPT